MNGSCITTTLNPKTPTVESCGSCIASCKALAEFDRCGAIKETYGNMFFYVCLRRTCSTNPDLCFQEIKDQDSRIHSVNIFGAWSCQVAL